MRTESGICAVSNETTARSVIMGPPFRHYTALRGGSRKGVGRRRERPLEVLSLVSRRAAPKTTNPRSLTPGVSNENARCAGALLRVHSDPVEAGILGAARHHNPQRIRTAVGRRDRHNGPIVC